MTADDFTHIFVIVMVTVNAQRRRQAVEGVAAELQLDVPQGCHVTKLVKSKPISMGGTFSFLSSFTFYVQSNATDLFFSIIHI